MRVVTILGTRPEVIKLAPVVAELRRSPVIETVVVSTGQHREMLDQMLAQFELATDIDLDLMRPEQRLSDLTADLVRGLGQTVAAIRPDWVLVQGDTTTTLCGALAAFYEASRSRTSKRVCAPATIGRPFRKKPIGVSLPGSRHSTSARPRGVRRTCSWRPFPRSRCSSPATR